MTLKRQIRYRKAPAGYGLALLMVFIASSILIGTSFQLLSGPVAMTAMGASSQANLSARQLAITALETVEADIQSRLNNGEIITTAYRYPSSGTADITAPTDPGNLAGASTAIGNYYATVTLARGNTYVVKINATASGSTVEYSKLLSMNSTTVTDCLLDDLPSAATVYALRKLLSTYSNSAIRVRRPSDSTEQDIGFDSNGDLDINSLLTFVGIGSPPVDAVAGASAAYGLRKMRAAYSGSAIRVRRSSDSTEQDIGFDSDGNLDISTLSSFAGASNVYMDTWYDQSGNGLDLTQATTSYQPRITYNLARPVVTFDGTDDYLGRSGFTTISTTQLTAFTVGTATNGSNTWMKLFSAQRTADANDWNFSTSAVVFGIENGTDTFGSWRQGGMKGYSYIDFGTPFQATTVFNGTNQLMRVNGSNGVSVATSGTFNIQNFRMGTSMMNDANNRWRGTISEVIIYPTALSTANQQIIERSQGYYYGIQKVPYAYIAKWYDQSGNNLDATQATQSKQAWLATDLYSGKPAIHFNGSQYLANSSVSGFISGGNLTSSLVASLDASSDNYGRVVTIHRSGDSSDWTTNTSIVLTAAEGNVNSISVNTNSVGVDAINILTTGRMFQASSYHDATNTLRYYVNGVSQGQTNTAMNLAPNLIIIGAGRSNITIDTFMTGKVAETIVFNRNLSNADRQTIENDQKSYNSIP